MEQKLGQWERRTRNCTQAKRWKVSVLYRNWSRVRRRFQGAMTKRGCRFKLFKEVAKGLKLWMVKPNTTEKHLASLVKKSEKIWVYLFFATSPLPLSPPSHNPAGNPVGRPTLTSEPETDSRGDRLETCPMGRDWVHRVRRLSSLSSRHQAEMSTSVSKKAKLRLKRWQTACMHAKNNNKSGRF